MTAMTTVPEGAAEPLWKVDNGFKRSGSDEPLPAAILRIEDGKSIAVVFYEGRVWLMLAPLGPLLRPELTSSATMMTEYKDSDTYEILNVVRKGRSGRPYFFAPIARLDSLIQGVKPPGEEEMDEAVRVARAIEGAAELWALQFAPAPPAGDARAKLKLVIQEEIAPLMQLVREQSDLIRVLSEQLAKSPRIMVVSE